MAGDRESLRRDGVPRGSESRAWTLAAFGVHIFTASGAALGLLALVAAVQGQWSLMFLLLGIALIVDGVDGAIARRLEVGERLPRWSGETLDLVVDFVTYSFVPAYAIAAGGFMPSWAAVPAAILVVVTSALYFADRNMKTDDNFFRGFPAVWNAAAFYLFLIRPGPWVGAASILALAVLTFVPVKFLHPFRVKRLRPLSVALLALWSVLALVAIIQDMAPGPWIIVALCGIGLYFFSVGLLRLPD
ncbi:MAG: CDP-alcohol phosphatidyltransferase family protein [Xanthobacteraceae bacterium]|nr:CDP-alcohol phosphatidyltransferase family protein [Xanthobacteraceae bacterium]